MEVKLVDVPIAWPALAEPKKFGQAEGEPAYGGRFVIVPGSENAKKIKEAMLDAAKGRWKEDGAQVLKNLVEKGKVCFVEKEYTNEKGEPYLGFKGMHYLQTRSPKQQPTVLDRFGKKVESKSDIERLIHSGCVVVASVEIWAQDNQYGRRINASLRGVMWRAEGEHFGGGSAPAAEDEFASYASAAEDYV